MKTPSSRSPWTITLGQEWVCEGLQVLGMFLTGPLPPPEPLKLFVNGIINRNTAHGPVPFSLPVLGGNRGNSQNTVSVSVCLSHNTHQWVIPFMAQTPALLIPMLPKPSTAFCLGYMTEWAHPLEKRRGAEKVGDEPPQTHTLRSLGSSPISPGPSRKASLPFLPLISLTPANYSSIIQLNTEFLPSCGSLSLPTPWWQGNSALYDVIKHSNSAFRLTNGGDPHKRVYIRRATQ